MFDGDQDPLDTLFADNSAKLDKERLAHTVQPYIRLFKDGEIGFTKAWEELNLQGKILTFLLARKVLEIKGIARGEQPVSQEATPKEMEVETRQNGNSIRPTLAKLLGEHLIKRKGDGDSVKYFVPDYSLDKVYEVIEKKDSKK